MAWKIPIHAIYRPPTKLKHPRGVLLSLRAQTENFNRLGLFSLESIAGSK